MRSNLDGPIQQTIFIPKTQRPGGAITFFVDTRQDPLARASSVTSVCTRWASISINADLATVRDRGGLSLPCATREELLSDLAVYLIVKPPTCGGAHARTRAVNCFAALPLDPCARHAMPAAIPLTRRRRRE